jgi:hypothetical protein
MQIRGGKNSDSGEKKLGSAIRDKYPGSATLLPALLLLPAFLMLPAFLPLLTFLLLLAFPAVAGFPSVAYFPLLLVLLLSVQMTLY